MKMLPAITLCAVTVTGCANTPHATIGYLMARTDAQVTVVRTVKCDKDNHPHIVDLPKLDVSYRADPTAPGTLDTSKLDGAFSDTTLDLKFTADQRLASVNATSTGQGEGILKAALSLASSIFLPKANTESGVKPLGTPSQTEVEQQCAKLTRLFGDNPMTIAYTGNIASNRLTDDKGIPLPDEQAYDFELLPVPQDKQLRSDYSALLGTICVKHTASAQISAPVTKIASMGNYATLTARQPRPTALQISISNDRKQCPIEDKPIPMWTSALPVGQLGTKYQIPIPHAAVFGKQSFDLVLDDSGALTQLKYGKETGAGQAIAVAQQAVDTAKPSTDAERTAAINAEIELRKAQEHRVKCLADPAAC
ncbi:hypothetical protein [Sphingomonas sp. SUN039]|uniref:hypothetical protein n=1 Tax=Sphingomonas sp. SUN039 TaxID=2937787 RepID=UPI0021643569|nr:hypothetical protein [Sphingomonas sp. SUN039]UVO54921.1 hypothetical protein M0209_12600 [Sphingomonas sp. SUN039]